MQAVEVDREAAPTPAAAPETITPVLAERIGANRFRTGARSEPGQNLYTLIQQICCITRALRAGASWYLYL